MSTVRTLTEAEAGDKWCPMARETMFPDCLCIASRCMMWRWSEDAFETKFYPHGTIPRGDSWEKTGVERGAENPTQPDIEYRRPRHVGYCGLAGRPE